jgi:uncharacterized protein (DUF2267 family)
MQGNRNATGADSATSRAGRRTPLRTIDDLERREHEASASERDAAHAIAALLRELAVRLPDESTLIREFAKHADTLDVYGRSPWFSPIAVDSNLDNFVHRLVEHFEHGAPGDES